MLFVKLINHIITKNMMNFVQITTMKKIIKNLIPVFYIKIGGIFGEKAQGFAASI